jgi:hypothetical protein
MDSSTLRFVWTPRQDHDDAHHYLPEVQNDFRPGHGMSFRLSLMRLSSGIDTNGDLRLADVQQAVREEFDSAHRRSTVSAGSPPYEPLYEGSRWRLLRRLDVARQSDGDLQPGEVTYIHYCRDFEYVAQDYLKHTQLTNYLFNKILPDPNQELPKFYGPRNFRRFFEFPVEIRQIIWRAGFTRRRFLGA